MKFLLALLFILTSCDDTPSNWDNFTVLDMAKEVEPNLRVMVPESFDKPVVDCKLYKPACKAGYKIKLRGMMIMPLEYTNYKDAYDCARRINAYWVKNWVFDDIIGEPILERFIEKTYGAKKAREVEFSLD